MRRPRAAASKFCRRPCGRAAWRRITKAADELGLDPTEVGALAEAAFTHIHEIMQAAIEGHTEARLRSTGELQRRRKRLLDLLLADPPGSPEAVEELAHSARWRVPERVAVTVLAGTEPEEDERLLLSAGVLADLTTRPARFLVPDPDGPGPSPGRALTLRGLPAAVGPTVPLAEAADSLRWAVRALSLTQRGILPAGSVIRCADHLTTLVLYADEALVRTLSRRVLAPLDGISTPQRDRLAETLLAWLQSGNSVSGTALRLHIHQQTVRYRLRQLEKLFGAVLRDTQTRFELELALRAEGVPGLLADPPPRPVHLPVRPPVSALRPAGG